MLKLIYITAFTTPCVEEMHRGLAAALSELAFSCELNDQIISQYKMNIVSDNSVKFSFTLNNQPFSRFCEECSLTKSTYPEIQNLVQEGTLNAFLNNPTKPFNIYVDSNEQDSASTYDFEISILKQLLKLILKHYGKQIIEPQFSVTYKSQVIDFQLFDFYVNMPSKMYNYTTGLCPFYPNKQAMLSYGQQLIQPGNNAKTVKIQDVLTQYCGQVVFKVIFNSLHADSLTQLISELGLTCDVQKLNSYQDLNQLETNQIVFADFWRLREYQLYVNQPTIQVVEIDDSIRQLYYFKPLQILMQTDSSILDSVILQQININNRKITGSTSKLTSVIGNQQLSEAISAATQQLLTHSFDQSQFPFNIQHYKLKTYQQVQTNQFGHVYPVKFNQTQQFPKMNKIIKGGMLEYVIYTGWLKVAVANSSLIDQIQIRDILYTSGDGLEDWWLSGIALILSQQYGRLIQVQKIQISDTNSDSTFIQKALGTKFDFQKDLKGGKQFDIQSQIIALSLGQISQTPSIQYNYTTGLAYIDHSYAVISTSKLSFAQMFTPCKKFICNLKTDSCEILDRIFYQNYQKCKKDVIQTSKITDEFKKDKTRLVFDIGCELLMHKTELGGEISDTQISSQISPVYRMDAWYPLTSQNIKGRAMGLVALFSSLIIMVLASLALCKFGSQKR
ncbi:Hypothetical_protein [Hexamita inflata]|uniref:Hypothetical_protein n=1 Tax=Hexamita inflata TaxID=28002 RepID=A0AA86NYL3_9EUKA|nr:Hypothetical protein HINF_LOCUS14769 [Hexamita inflata]